MKRVFCIILAFAMLFAAACSDDGQSEIRAEMESALDEVNGEARLSCNYLLEITFDGSKVLYYAKGNACWDRDDLRITTIYDRTYLGNTLRMESYLANGENYSLVDGTPVKIDSISGNMFEQFPQFRLPSVGEEGEISVSDNLAGKAYKFAPEDAEALCQALVGDIYGIAQVIEVPQRDKTEYSNAQCVYTVKDGRIASARYELDIKLFDTPMLSKDEEDYTLDLHVSAKLEYIAFGNSVGIAEYEPPEEKPNGSSPESTEPEKDESEETAESE